MPFFKRCLIQSISRIEELHVNQSHSLTKPHIPTHAQKACVKHPPFQAGQDPLEHTSVLRLVGTLRWASMRTRPDIAWAVARITRLAISDEARARVCVFDMLLST